MPTEGALGRRKAGRVRGLTRLCWVTAVAAGLLLTSSAQAAVVEWGLGTHMEFSEGVPPEGPPPWLAFKFDDHDSAGTVDLELQASGLIDQEFVFEWSFNLDPLLDPTELDFDLTLKAGTFSDATVNTGINAFRADGDGYYDIQFVFDSAASADLRFGAGESVYFQITGPPELTALSFREQSELGGGQGAYITAAHIGGIGPSDNLSGWICPEPASFSLVLLGGLLIRRPRR